MRTLLVAAVLAVPAAAQDFDAALDPRAFLEQARAQPTSLGRPDTDCAALALGPDQTQSQTVQLRSTTWYEDCYWVPGDPRHGGGRRECVTRPGPTYYERVKVRIEGKKPLLPWERDTFRVCLTGMWLDARPLATAYTYRQTGGAHGEFVYAPGEKIAMKPDPKGIAVESLSPALVLTLRDKWASYYAGERLKLVLTVNEELRNWPDPTVATLESEAASGSERYELALAKHIGDKLKPGKKYYVKVAFRRLGKVSKDDLTQAGESPAVAYQPGVSLAAAR